MVLFTINMDNVATKPGARGRMQVEDCSSLLCNRTVPRNGGKVDGWDAPYLMLCRAPDMDTVRVIVRTVWEAYPECAVYCDNGTEFLEGQEYND